jgi:hypothetical protein
MIRKAPTSPTTVTMYQEVCVPMSQRKRITMSALLYQQVRLAASHLYESKVRIFKVSILWLGLEHARDSQMRMVRRCR